MKNNGNNKRNDYKINNLIDKETPMKPINQEIEYCEGGRPFIVGVCRKCSCDLRIYEHYCSRCGQRLDWSEDDEN